MTAMRRLGLVLDCIDTERLAAFWAAALGYQLVGGAGQYVLLLPSEPEEPKLLLQGVPEAKVVKNRMHLDIETADIRARQHLDPHGRPRGQRVLRV
jgi:hypothetical protein